MLFSAEEAVDLMTTIDLLEEQKSNELLCEIRAIKLENQPNNANLMVGGRNERNAYRKI